MLILYSLLSKKQMTDAALSDAKETISVSSAIGEATECSQLIPVKENTIKCDDDEKHSTVNDSQKDQSQDDVIATANSYQCLEKKLQNSIPTAIVKPKYQRVSYDDRQLPPVVCIDREKSWFDNNQPLNNNNHNNNNNNNSNINVAVATRKIQLPHFERKYKKKSVNGAVCRNLIVSEKEKLNSLRLCEKDIDSSSVAIVTPRKKDKMEQTDMTALSSYGNENKGPIKCCIPKHNANAYNNNISNTSKGYSSSSNNNNHTSITRPSIAANEKVKDSKDITGIYECFQFHFFLFPKYYIFIMWYNTNINTYLFLT